MRTLLIGLTFLLPAAAAAGDKPIPQDPAAVKQRQRELLEWNRRTIPGAYDKVGKKDPRWDVPARKAMDVAALLFSQQIDQTVAAEEIYTSAKAAKDAGCDDPMLLYLFHKFSLGTHYPGEEEAILRMSATAKALAASPYPAFRRAVVLVVAGGYELYTRAPSEAFLKDGQRYYDAILALLPESVSSDERTPFWEDRWFEQIVQCIRCFRTLGMEAEAAYNRVDAALAKIPELKVLRLQVRAEFYLRYGWEARTNAFAPAVPPGGFATLEQRLGEAKKASEEAWKLRPEGSRTPNMFLAIEKAIGDDRDTMELWFDRAMKANSDNREACWSKLDWLDPKWHGTPEEMLAFGKACRDTKNWNTGITVLACDAHRRYMSMLPVNARWQYISSPEVLNEIKSIYDEFLKHHPIDYVERSKYASILAQARQFPEAHAQFEILGDRLTQWTEFPYTPLATLKDMREHCAKFVGAERKDAPK
jgi:hypothetical protein